MMNTASAKNWYLIYTKQRQESVALNNLVRQGYEVYFPVVRQTSKRHRQSIAAVLPLFPRYLFIRLDAVTDNWGPIRSTLGVISIVRFGQQAARVPDDLIDLLRESEDGQGMQVLPVKEFSPGSRVRIVEGVLAGYEGVFLAKSGRDRVAVLLDILGKQTRTVIDAHTIEPGD